MPKRVQFTILFFTNNLAVILYLGGAKDQALAELESIRGQASDQTDPVRAGILSSGGNCDLEQGRTLDARALEDYLRRPARCRMTTKPSASRLCPATAGQYQLRKQTL